MNVLFWNLKQNNVCFDVICHIAREESIDVMAFAEFPSGANEVAALLTKLQSVKPSFMHHPHNQNSRVEIFFDSSSYTVDPIKNDDRLSFKMIKKLTGLTEINFVFCHLQSKMHKDEVDLTIEAVRNMSIIRDFEKNNGEMTVICGDFNLHPFESGMLADLGFNALMDSSIVQNRKTRVVSGNTQTYFYNPMWSLLGDIHLNDTPGTFYANGPNVSYLWHMFDQVIMRPDVIPFFVKKDLRILAKGASYNLLSSGGVISTKYSDHLPIKFNLSI